MASNKSKSIDNSLLHPMYNQIFGAPGTWITNGRIVHEEYLPQLMWRRGIDVFDHMRRSDASIQALLKVIKHPLLAATWDIEASSSEPFDQYVARFLKNELFNRNVVWFRFLRDALGMADFGFSVFEKTYEKTEFEGQTRYGIQELGWRKQWSILKWDTMDSQPGVTQQLLSGTVDIPQEKLLVFTNDREGDNYEGVSLLRYVYKDWDLKKQVENLMITDLSRSLGFPIVWYNPQASRDDQIKMENVLKNFRSHEKQYMFGPEGKFTFDWAKIESNTQKFLPVLEYLQHEIDKSILAQFLDLAGSRSGGSGGSRALSEDHSQLYEKALEAIGNVVVDEMNTNLIQQICDFNWTDMPNGYPKMVYSNIGDKNLSELADAVNKMGSVDFLTPDPDLENKIRQWLDLPDLPDDIYQNYDTRTTAQTTAQPLTQLGPGQNPNQPSPTGQPLQNPSVVLPSDKTPGNNKPGSKLPSDQTNRVTRTNEKRDRANEPTPEASSYRLQPGQGRTRAALDEAKVARARLMASIMEDAEYEPAA